MPAWATGRRTPLRRRVRASRWFWLLLGGGPVALIAFALLPEPAAGPGTRLVGPVERVADGDTLELGGQHLRLVGLDAPEYDQTCGGAAATWPCGRAATDRLRDLVRNLTLTCTAEGRDRYGRVLGVCTAAGTDIGQTLVHDGLAVAAGRYGAVEAEARAARRGIWQGDFDRPADWRAQRGDATGTAGNPSRMARFIAWLAGLFGS